MLTEYAPSINYAFTILRKADLSAGVKRDTLLLKRIISARDSVLTVLDISFHANREPLLQLLKQGNTVHYFDHHFAGEIPESPLFHTTY